MGGDEIVNVYADFEPVLNSFVSNDYKINVIVDRKYIDSLEAKGADVIRYQIKADRVPWR